MKKKTTSQLKNVMIVVTLAGLGYVGYISTNTPMASQLVQQAAGKTCDNYRMQQYVSSRSVSTHLNMDKIVANAESIYCVNK